MRRILEFIRDKKALTTVEFVVVFPFFLILVLYALEIALALFWWQSVDQAAQLGARLAVTWDPGVASVPSTNPKTSSGIYGKPCTTDCTGYYGTVSFTSAGCASNVICSRMENFFPPIVHGSGTVIITYSSCAAPTGGSCPDGGSDYLGFAGGPIVPYVKVTISNVPFNIIEIPILPNIVSTMPPMTAMLTGEDMSSTAGS